MVLAEQAGWLPPVSIQYTSLPLWFGNLIVMLIVVGLQAFFTRSYRNVLRQLRAELGVRRQTERALRESESRFRAMFEGAAIGMGLADAAGYVIQTNPALRTLLGYSDAELRRMKFTQFTHPDDVHQDEDLYRELMQGKRAHYRIVKRYCCKDGRLIWGDLSVSAICDPSGKPQYTVGMIEDITERKQIEDRLLYMSNHDALTNLYNRTYFEDMLARLDQVDQYPVSVMIVDVDGLKLTNDAQGHAAGDELLRRTADILRAAARKDDVVARIGGDEFAILLPRTDQNRAERVLDRFRLKLAENNDEHAGNILYLSIGVATATESGLLTQTIIRADEHMYQDKYSRHPESLPRDPFVAYS
jgi:diguanylate cyclase (GGDEF)-like protein/PAS domain S-box-containing protein